MNVAVTRAQALLIVVGDAKTLAHDPNWGALMYPGTRNLKPESRIPKLDTRNPKLETKKPKKLKTGNRTLGARNPKVPLPSHF